MKTRKFASSIDLLSSFTSEIAQHSLLTSSRTIESNRRYGASIINDSVVALQTYHVILMHFKAPKSESSPAKLTYSAPLHLKSVNTAYYPARGLLNRIGARAHQ